MRGRSRSLQGVRLRDRTAWIWDHLEATERLLEVGRWDGDGTVAWADKAEALFGIDVASAVFDGHPDVVRAQASAERLPFRSATFDTVVSSEVLEHLPTGMERPALAEIRRVITPNGRLLLTTPHKGWFAWLDPMDAKRRLRLRHRGHRHYSWGQIEALLAGLFVSNSSSDGASSYIRYRPLWVWVTIAGGCGSVKRSATGNTAEISARPPSI